MNLVVNGEPRQVSPGATVASVIALLEVDPGARGVAVAVDGEVVARSRWTDTQLHEGSTVEVLAAIQGG